MESCERDISIARKTILEIKYDHNTIDFITLDRLAGKKNKERYHDT